MTDTQEALFTTVHSMQDLPQFGLNPLTGEACALSMRTLCDVNAEGKALLEEFFGVQDINLAAPWNSTVFVRPAIGSIMITREMVKPLAQFGFFRAGALAVVVQADSSMDGIFTAERLAQYEKMVKEHPQVNCHILRNYSVTSSHPMVGTRNVHAFTGRAQ